MFPATFLNFGPACSAIFLLWSFGAINQLELSIYLDIYAPTPQSIILRERKLFRGFIGKVILFRQENSPLKNNSNGWSPIFNQIYLKESSAWNPGILESSRKFRCFCLIYNEITTIWHFARLWPNLRLKPHLDLHKLQHCRLTWLACMNYSKLEKVQSTSSYAANLNEP